MPYCLSLSAHWYVSLDNMSGHCLEFSFKRIDYSILFYISNSTAEKRAIMDIFYEVQKQFVILFD